MLFAADMDATKPGELAPSSGAPIKFEPPLRKIERALMRVRGTCTRFWKWDDLRCRGRRQTEAEIGPGLTQEAAFFEKIAAPIGGLDFVADSVREGQLDC